MANQKGALEGFYRLIMRRNSVYVSFIIAGAFFGERVRHLNFSFLFFSLVYFIIYVPDLLCCL